MTTLKPAPWHLSGKGYILVYKLKRSFVKEKAFVHDFLHGKSLGGFGFIMLVDYESSNVGPYGELLFIPGKFKYKEKRLYSITKIYVSTLDSVVNGRNNWGIPKEKADFRFELIDESKERIVVSNDDKLIADFEIDSGKVPFPISTKVLPFPLIQRYEGKDYYTSFSGSGKGRLAKIKRLKINQEMFPDVSEERLIGVIEVDPFHITFPTARIEKI